MIISASRRTDIPAFYADWLVNRINAGYCLVKNPYNPAQIRRVSLLPEDVDGIVLWTKNAAPLLPKISALDRFVYYFQYTITPYFSDIETALADKKSIVIPAFQSLANVIGAERVIWRYDPIIFTDRYDFSYHSGAFARLCGLLSGNTKKCVISFVAEYKSIAGNFAGIGNITPTVEDKIRLAETLLAIANEHGITLCACCESPQIYLLGIRPISCVSAELIGGISGKPLNIPRDKNQRKGCNCAESVDIGAYNCCMNGCRYCYANRAETSVRKNYAAHNADSETLIQ